MSRRTTQPSRLRRTPHKPKDRRWWWYEEAHGITIVFDHLAVCPGRVTLPMLTIRWRELRAALRRKGP